MRRNTKLERTKSGFLSKQTFLIPNLHTLSEIVIDKKIIVFRKVGRYLVSYTVCTCAKSRMKVEKGEGDLAEIG